MSACLVRLREIVDNLPTAERKVARVVLDYPENTIGMQIEELATSCNVSTASIVRLCKRMGYAGYKDFCRALSVDLALQRNEVAYEDIQLDSELDAVARNICMSNIKAIENTLVLFDYKELERAVQALCDAKRIDFYGVGSSRLVAVDACNKFMRIDKVCMSGDDAHGQILAASTLKEGDCAVLISYTGETLDTIESMSVAKSAGATIITITKYGDNPLNQQADIRLFADYRETLLRSAAMGSRIGLLTVIDVLFTAVASRIYSEVKPVLDKTKKAIDRKRMRMTN